ncbi:Transcription factor domain-containing protein [Madurella fahalii]|uniref:Transcription factor domain-containing protein n=1 Tax=Madurella fahalii TaxID=1157608 RepID=A0ABQ0GS19_9PEZI
MAAVGSSTSVVAKVLKGPRACTTCARAKSRCIPGPKGQEKCERCHRLRKPCSSQTPAPPRKRKEPKPTRVAELERRLEDLTARIESVQRLGSTVQSPPDSEDHCAPPRAPGVSEGPRGSVIPPNACASAPTFGRDCWSSQFAHLFPKKSIFEAPDEQQQQQERMAIGRMEVAVGADTPSLAPVLAPPLPPGPGSASTAISSPNRPFCQQPSPQPPQRQAQSLWPHEDEAESLLAEYKTHMGHLNPFAIVPPRMSSAELREQKPFLWKAIMTQSCLFDGPRQIALGNELLREISEAAFMKPQKSLDLLQGLQILISWFHYNLNKFQMTNLLFLARSITAGLGFAETGALPDKGGYTSESLEKMRAFAGTYYLVTITFTTNKKPDGLMNTSYLTTCCRALHSQMEYPTDELLVHLVRAQQLSQSISQGHARRNATPRENQVPEAAFVQGLRDRIRAFAVGLPPHIRVNPSIIGHLQVAELILYENILPELSWCPLSVLSGGQQSAAPTPGSTADPDPEHLELLWTCVRAVRAYMTNRFANEIGDYPRYMCMSSFDLTYVFLTMLKLASLQVPGWDLARARDELCFDDCVTQLIKDMEHTAERRKRRRRHVAGGGSGSPSRDNDGHIGSVSADEQGEREAEDPFSKVARKIRSVKDQVLLARFDNVYTTSQPAQASSCDCDPVPMTLADATQDLMQDLGGGLWQDVMSSMPDWNAFILGESVDWAAVFANYDMGEPGYAQ